MRGRMTKNIQAFQSLGQHRFDLNRVAVCLLIQRVSKIDFAAVDTSSQRLLRNVAVQLLQRVGNGRRAGNLYRRAVFELYVDLAHLSLNHTGNLKSVALNLLPTILLRQERGVYSPDVRQST